MLPNFRNALPSPCYQCNGIFNCSFPFYQLVKKFQIVGELMTSQRSWVVPFYKLANRQGYFITVYREKKTGSKSTITHWREGSCSQDLWPWGGKNRSTNNISMVFLTGSNILKLYCKNYRKKTGRSEEAHSFLPEKFFHENARENCCRQNAANSFRTTIFPGHFLAEEHQSKRVSKSSMKFDWNQLSFLMKNLLF